MSRLVIIHDTDADGIASAWLLNKFIGPQHSSVLLIPQRAGENNPPYDQLTEDDHLFLVDRTYPLRTLASVVRTVESITVIDHHKSRLDEYANEPTVNSDAISALDLSPSKIYFEFGNISVLVDTAHSACMLTHFYCMEHADNVPVTPYWFISYIEDRDMWWFKLPDSKEVNAAMWLLGMTAGNMDVWCRCHDPHNTEIFIDYLVNMKSIGTTVLLTQQNTIKNLAHGPTVIYRDIWKALLYLTVPVELHGKKSLKVAMLCCPFELISDLGNYMLDCTDEGFEQPEVVMCYNYLTESSQYVYSIRSKVPMDWFAKANDGGGQPLACGFKSSHSPLELAELI